MANKYSTLYARPADQPTGAVSYMGPTAERSGGVEAVAAISGAVGSGDVLYLRGGFMPGEVILGIDITHSADSNITAADLVLRPRDGSADIELVAASAALDGTANTSVAFSTMAGNTVPNDGKQYDLCWIAGAAGAASVHNHVIRSAAPLSVA